MNDARLQRYLRDRDTYYDTTRVIASSDVGAGQVVKNLTPKESKQ